MNSQQMNPSMGVLQVSMLLLCCVVLFQLFASQIDAQRSTSPWQTLSGDAPLVIARGGFSGIYPESSLAAYRLATQKSLAGVVQWCDVQLTQDEVGICFPDLDLAIASTISSVYPNSNKTYTVNGVPTEGWFAIDFSLINLTDVYLIQGIGSRSPIFNANEYKILTIQDVAMQMMETGFWLNVQHDAFYTQHNLNMSRFLLSVSKTVNINFISSPEVNFFKKINGRFGRNGPIFVFQFSENEDHEPTTNQSYVSLLSNLTFVKTFASGILVPKSYILPVDDDTQYLLPQTSLVQDAHKAGLQVYVSGLSNDVLLAYNYSYDPVSEYLSFVDNGDFSVDGVLSDFPITASASVDCFSDIGINATKQVDFLVISNDGASGDYPGCTDLAYENAIKDGADVIDCSVQMSSDGIPFCLSSIDLKNSTTVAQTPLVNRSTNVPEISSVDGIYTFNLTWPEIRNLTPAISKPFSQNYQLVRNPTEGNSGKLILLSEFLNLAKSSTSLYGVLISVENAVYLREMQGLDIIKSVLDALTETGYSNGTTTKKVLLQSTDSSVLIEFKKQSKYETVYKIEENIGDIFDSAVENIKTFANAVVIRRSSVFLSNDGFLTEQTNIVQKLQKNLLPVYVELFQNEFLSQAYDFFSDATVQINSYISGAGINGTITDFPLTAARYKRNRCLGYKVIPPYMSPVISGSLLSTVNPQALRPAQPPTMVFTDDNVTEPLLPPVKAKAPTSTLGTPSTNAQEPRKQRSHGTWVKPIGIFSGSSAGVVLFMVLLILFLCFLRMRNTKLRHHMKLKALIPLEHYTYAQVKRITKSFAEVVGRGGFGIVYRGTLGDSRMVAVKVLKDSQGNGEDFINEVASMSRTSHLNIVSLLGFCSEGSKKAIIYEFLENGSLDKFISGKTSVNLDCTTLYKIALGVARGLEYLHHGCKTRIVHFDIKPQNVLLDENFCPKVSDFGLAKLCEKKESILSLLETRGTVGYIAPEMISRVYGNVSHKSDVYSYGMLVLDMIGARNKENAKQASTSNSNISSMYFPEWVYRGLELGNSGKPMENGFESEENELVKKMTLVGLWCIQPSPSDRPPMNRVVEMMEGSLDDLEVPPRPQIPVVSQQESSTFNLEDISVCTA